MSVYLNNGARWQRPDGSWIESGAEFVPTDDERLRKAHKLEYLRPGGGKKAAKRGKDVDDYAVGGGWYLIAGEKVQGRDAAAERLGELSE